MSEVSIDCLCKVAFVLGVTVTGELDELSRPLPKSSAESKVQVGGEFVVAKTYKASDAVLKEFMTYLPIDSVKDFDAHLADVGYKANCRNPEIYALMDYSGDGYKDVNAALRKLDLEGAQSTKLDPVLNSRVRSARCKRSTLPC